MGQYPIKSEKDLPFIGAYAYCAKYGRELLQQLITPPDTINNEWEKYAIYYLSDNEYGFSASDCEWLKIEKPFYYYIDTLTRKFNGLEYDTNLGVHLFEAARNGDITFLSYDIKHKAKPEEVINVLKYTENDDFMYHFEIHKPDTIIQRSIDKVSSLEFKQYAVIEKTIRTKKFQIQSKILAICIIGDVYGDNDNYMGTKAYGWFILPE